MPDCVFCKIIAKELPSQVVYEDESVLAINDIHPQTPIHVVLILKKHIETMNDVTDFGIYGKVFKAVSSITKQLGIQESGYRIVANCNKDGGQTIFHLHFHILGGQTLSVRMN